MKKEEYIKILGEMIQAGGFILAALTISIILLTIKWIFFV